MKAVRVQRSWRSVWVAVGLMACSVWGHAADARVDASAQAKYEKDRAACLSGKTNQDQATCLKEAGAALQARKQAPLDAPGQGPATQRENALARCSALPVDQRADCVARTEGDQTTESGSANAGGILRERVTRQPVLPPGNTPPAPASAP